MMYYMYHACCMYLPCLLHVFLDIIRLHLYLLLSNDFMHSYDKSVAC